MSPEPHAAVNASGDWAVAWGDFSTNGGLCVRRGARGHGLGRTEVIVIAKEISEPADLVVAPDGTTAIAWVRPASHGRPRAAMLALATRDGAFGHARPIAAVGRGVYDVRLTASSERMVAAWNQRISDRKAAVRYAIGDARGRFGPARTLASSSSEHFDAAADRNGNVVVSYQTFVTGTQSSQLAAAVLPRDASAFNAPQVISRDTQDSIPGSGAAGILNAGPGGIAAVYTVTGITPDGAVLPRQMRVTALQHDLTFGAPQTFGTDNGTGEHGVAGPAVALPSTGSAVAAWAPYNNGCGECDYPKTGELDAAVQQPDGSFGSRVQLSRKPAPYLQVAATTNAAIFVWGEGRFDRQRLRYVVHTASGRFTAPRLLDRHVLRDAALAGAGHHAVVAWISGHTLRAAQLTD